MRLAFQEQHARGREAPKARGLSESQRCESKIESQSKLMLMRMGDQ
jgi:hypothetical protein